MTIIEVILQEPPTTVESYSLTGIPSGGSTGQSLVKASTVDYDAVWDTVIGSGDMLRSIYDPDADGKISHSQLTGVAVQPLNTLVINSVSDFPIQDATTITLSDDTAYIMGAFITTSKRFIVGGGVTITSFASASLTLEYTGTGTMFTASSGDFVITSLTYSCPNGTIFEYGGYSVFVQEKVFCISCVNMGSFTGPYTPSVNWGTAAFPNISGQGIQFNVAGMFIVGFSKVYMEGTSPTFNAIDLGTCIFNDVELASIVLSGVAGSVGIKGLVGSGNISQDSIGNVASSNIGGGAMTPLSGILPSDIRWVFTGNSEVEDTMECALIYLSSNATNTVIVAASNNGTNAIKVAGTWVSSTLSKYSASSSGTVTYLGERKVTVLIDASLHLVSVGGGSVTAKVYLKKDGVIVAGASGAVDISGSTSKNVSIPWVLTVTQGQYLELFIENQSNSNDILVQNATFRVC